MCVQKNKRLGQERKRIRKNGFYTKWEEGNYFAFTNASLDNMRVTPASTIISNPLGFFASPSRQSNCKRWPTLEVLLFSF